MNKIKVKLTLTEEMLGTKAANPNVFADFIASKAPNEDKRRQEIETAEHIEEAGTSVFHRQEDKLGIYDYQIKGFFKDACKALNRADEDARNALEKLSAYKDKIDGTIFVDPRFIFFELPENAQIGVCERPLRASTAQGERVSLARSETIPAGSTITFEITCLTRALTPYVMLWLAYGERRGLGQWRNSGKGRFEVEVLEAKA